MPRCEFIFDFASPNAYLSRAVVQEIEKRQGVQFEYHLALLGGLFKLTNNQPPMVAFGSIPNKMAYIQLETKRFVEKHALSRFTFNPNFPINTLKLMRCAVAAQKAGALDNFITMGLKGMWEDGVNMEEEKDLAQAMDAAGLDSQALLAAAQTDEIKQQLMANTQAAADRGAFGIPTFFIDDEMFFGKETLGDVEALIEKKK